MKNRQNGNNPNKDRIRSGIESRRLHGERPRSMLKKGGRSALFPTSDPSFDMELPLSQRESRPEKGAALGQASKTSRERKNYSGAAHAGRERTGSGSASSIKRRNRRAESGSASSVKRKKLDTSYTTEARGISHVQRKKKQAHRDIIKVICALLAVLFVIAAAALFKSLTRVKTIRVVGSNKYGEAQLLSLSGLMSGKSIFSYSVGEMREAMDSVSDVRTTSVKKVYPNRIEITVEDVTARAALLASNETYTVISADGYVMSIGGKKPDGLLEVRGLSGYSFALNTCIDKTDRNIRTVGVLELIKALDGSELKDSALYIDVSGATYTVIGLENNYKVVLGAITTAPDCLYAAAEAYRRFLPVYPDGGTLNVYSGSSIVDFTPAEPAN